MVNITIQVGSETVQRQIGTVSDRIRRPQAAYREIAEYLLLATDRRYELEVSPNGIPWQPNSEYTLRLKRERGQILKVLQATGRMRGSYNYVINREKLVISNPLERARKHQLGIGVPVRQHLGISKEDNLQVVQIVRDHIRGDLRGGRRRR